MSQVKTYRYSNALKGFFILLGLAILALALYRGWIDGVEHVYAGVAVNALVLLSLVKLFRQRIMIENTRIVVRGRLLPDKSVYYKDVTQIRMGDSIDAIQVYASNGWWPDVSVHYGIHNWKDLAIELIKRVPPEVEVVDRLGTTTGVQQGIKWNGDSG